MALNNKLVYLNLSSKTELIKCNQYFRPYFQRRLNSRENSPNYGLVSSL